MHRLLNFLISISSFVSIPYVTTEEGWNYHTRGPDVWGDIESSCAGHSQSPINIRTPCTTYQSFTPFSFSLGYKQTYNFSLINNGHTIIGEYNGTVSSPLELTEGGLRGKFVFENFHLHWGENYNSGSEHQVNGKKYAGEIHFVHKNLQTSEFIVLSIFMQSDRSTNKAVDAQYENTTAGEWRKYFSKTKDLRNKTNSISMTLNLSLLMSENLNDFWRYQGSLTTPPCTENITWTVFKTPILFNDDDIKMFRDHILYEGYRGPQRLYDRIVYRNFPTETLSSIPEDYCCLNSKSSRNKLFYIFLFFNIINKLSFID